MVRLFTGSVEATLCERSGRSYAEGFDGAKETILSDDVIIVIAAGVALVLLITLMKLVGSVTKACVIALFASALLYLLLPRLEAQEGAIGEAARKAREVSEGLSESVKEVREQAKEATRSVSEGIHQMQEAAEAVEASESKAKGARRPAEAMAEGGLEAP